MKADTYSESLLRWPRPDGWQALAFLISFLVIVPLSVVMSALFLAHGEVWAHLVQTVLGELLINTFWLVLGVGLAGTVLGVSLAWLNAVCDFPGRRFFDWALVMPLALPAYVTAFVFIGLFEFTGPVQTFLRQRLGADNLWFPSIRSTGGVVLVMTLAFYPYIYLLARNAFFTQGKRAIEVAQTLGYGRWGGFLRAAVPMARPWIFGGLMLVLMEVLADFGAVSVFNYDTFTTAIYKAWFGLFSLHAAAQLSSLLVLLVFILFVVEQRFRLRMRYGQMGWGFQEHDRVVLKRARGWLVFFYCFFVLFVAFVLPVVQLSLWAYGVLERDLDSRYLGFLGHSLFLGAAAALLTVCLALILGYSRRLSDRFLTRLWVRLATLGYALPGTVLAVGIFIPMAWLDNRIAGWAEAYLHRDLGLLLTGTPAVMLAAYAVRFMAPAHAAIDSAMSRITFSLDEAARSLGAGGLRILGNIHLSILKGGLLTAAVLVFVDVMKEMPITLLTRPFGWDTLSVRIFEMTSEGEWERAALPAMVLVLAGLLPVFLLTRRSA